MNQSLLNRDDVWQRVVDILSTDNVTGFLLIAAEAKQDGGYLLHYAYSDFLQTQTLLDLARREFKLHMLDNLPEEEEDDEVDD